MSEPAIDYPAISPAERALRADAVRQADASNRLEGGVTSPERALLNEQYIAGHLDLDAYVAASLRLAHQTGRRIATPARPAARTR